MRLFLVVCLMISVNCFAQPVKVICYSGKNVIFNETVRDDRLEIDDGYIIVQKKGQAVVLTADCIMRTKSH